MLVAIEFSDEPRRLRIILFESPATELACSLFSFLDLACVLSERKDLAGKDHDNLDLCSEDASCWPIGQRSVSVACFEKGRQYEHAATRQVQTWDEKYGPTTEVLVFAISSDPRRASVERHFQFQFRPSARCLGLHRPICPSRCPAIHQHVIGLEFQCQEFRSKHLTSVTFFPSKVTPDTSNNVHVICSTPSF